MTRATTAIKGTVRVRAFDDAALRGAARDRGLDYGSLSKGEKFSLVEAATEAGTITPSLDETTHNQTLQQYHEHLVDLTDPATGVSTAFQPEFMAVGTDATAEDHTQTGLQSEYDRVDLTRTDNDGEDLYTAAFLDTGEANADDDLGLDLTEAMLTTTASTPTPANELNFNRAVIPALTKNSLTTATIEITLQYRP